MGILNRDDRDTTDQRDRKFRSAVDLAQEQGVDRWPARGLTGGRGGDYRPLDLVSREGRVVPYRRWPAER